MLNTKEQKLIENLATINVDYYSFHKQKELEIWNFNGHKYLILGSFYLVNNDLVLLNTEDCKVYYYNEVQFKVGFSPRLITLMNENLSNFILFQDLILAFIKYTFDQEQVFKNVENQFNTLLKTLEKDEYFKWSDDSYSIWKKKIYTLITDIEEKYECFLQIR